MSRVAAVVGETMLKEWDVSEGRERRRRGKRTLEMGG